VPLFTSGDLGLRLGLKNLVMFTIYIIVFGQGLCDTCKWISFDLDGRGVGHLLHALHNPC